MTAKNENESDLLLLAFRYISGEMTDEECVQFEEQLEQEQAARSAVTRVVQVGQAVAMANTELTPIAAVGVAKNGGTRTGETRRRWQAVAATLAVALLAAVTFSHWSDFGTSMWSAPHNVATDSRLGVEQDVDRPSQQASLDYGAGQLLALWSASASDFGQLFDESMLDDATSIDGADISSAAEFDPDDEVEFTVPDWMLAAVSPEDDSDNNHTIDLPEEN